MLCLSVSILIGAFLTTAFGYKNKQSKSFAITLFILPAIVCVVIMMVNGNIGTGVAVAGAFSLVRFRSVPGTAKEIAAVFLAMGAGLIAGMGYLGFAVLFAVVMGLLFMLLNVSSLGEGNASDRQLRITIPEDLNYSDVFEDIMKKYLNSYELESVKTTNMGAMFKLIYDISLKNMSQEKEFVDELRTRNGNLEISISKKEMSVYEL